MINTIKIQNTGISAIITALNDRPLRKHLIIYFCGIENENDNTYAKCCILYSKDVYLSVTQSKYMCVCVCARVRTCVWACVRVCVCQPLRQVRETFWSIQMSTLVFVLVVVEFSARVHPFRIC